MSTFFDEIRAIALSDRPAAEKVKELRRKRLKASEARTYIAFIELQNSRTRTSDGQNNIRPTIGVEIECFGFDKCILRDSLARLGIKSVVTGYSHCDSQDTYKLGHDGSINGDYPCEVVSPILKNLDSLREVCGAINKAGARVNKSCGLHVHFGATAFTMAQWRRIIMNYAAIESIIDTFMPMSRRADNNRYCKSIRICAQRVSALSDSTTIQALQTAFNDDRYHKLNVMSYKTHKTIEFRQHSGTICFAKIENWIRFLSDFLQWSIDHTEPVTANSIDELPFLKDRQKVYYNRRAEKFGLFPPV